MRKIEIENKIQIKQLLYAGCVLGIKGHEYSSFGGFKLWWYEKKHDTCRCAESHWVDTRKFTKACSFNKPVRTLWRHRKSLYISTKQLSGQYGLGILRILEKTKIESNKQR